jgi:hypothetical protein
VEPHAAVVAPSTIMRVEAMVFLVMKLSIWF